MIHIKIVFFLLQVRDLEMTITELEIQIKNDQNDWLRLQNNIVQLSERLTEQMNDSHLAKQRKHKKTTKKSFFLNCWVSVNLFFCFSQNCL